MVGVPSEDKVKIVVMYINGKAEFWWRGTAAQDTMLIPYLGTNSAKW